MKNLMSADFYKIFRNKSLLVCTIITIVLAIGSVFLLDFAYSFTETIGAEISVSEEDAIVQDSENISADSGAFVRPEANEMFPSSVGGNVSIFVAIIVAIFVGAEFNFGTIKNTATKAYSRSKIYVSKLVVSLIVSDLLFILYAGLFMLTATILWGFGTPAAGFGIMALKLFLLQMLLNSALTSLFVTSAFLLRQSGTAMALNLCIALEATTFIFMLADMLIQRIMNTDFALTDYLITTNITALSTQDLTNSLTVRSLLVGIGFTVAAIIVGLINFNRRDIK